MNTSYSLEDWATGTQRGRQVFNYGYSLSGKEFKGWKLLKVVAMRKGASETENAYVWESTSDPKHEIIRVNITERHEWRLAQESLHERLMECMRPDVPKGTKKLAKLGDVVFVGREPRTDIPSTISFTRGNVCISVSSAGEKSVDVSDFAARLDRALSEAPAKGEVEKGMVQAKTPRVAPVKANEAVVLIKSLPAAAPKGGWLKVIVPDGELRRKGEALIYETPQGGKKSVSIFAFGQGRR